MNKKGFTLIEILAVIVIIGITATIGIAAVSRNITKSRDASVVDLAKNYAEGARTMKAKDNFYYEPKNGEAIIIPYSGIEGVDIENGEETAYGAIIPSYCFIGIANNGGNFYYYINQADESYHIINGVEYNSLDQDDIIS
jgi:type IV pilus assembly protein PilA